MTPKIVCVAGPTACGKTTLGVLLAQRFHGEVVSADSMQIYRGMTVGTAAPTEAEMQGVPHHMIAVAEPSEQWSAAEYVAKATPIVDDILSRGKLPILVGGTGLYVQSFLYGVRFTEEKAPAGLREQLAEELAQKGGAALYAELQQVDPEAAAVIHPNNQVRVLRALEHYRATGKKLSELEAENPEKYAFDHMQIEELARKGGYVTYAGKQCTEYAVANSAARVCAAVLHNEHAVLSASTLMTGQYGEEGIFTSLPCIIGRNGVERVMELDLSQAELEAFHASCQHIRDNIAQLDWWDAEAYDAK